MSYTALPKLELSFNELRHYTLKALEMEPSTQYLNICANIAEILVEERKVEINNNQFGGVIYSSKYMYSLNSIDMDRVREIIWDLVIERVLTIGINDSNPNWPWLKLTHYGYEILKSSKPIPNDPSGYFKYLQSEIPNLDDIIFTYLDESLAVYSINKILSCTITLGCASEKALLLLIGAYTNAILDENKKNRFIEKTNGRMIKRQFDEFTKKLPELKNLLPYELADGLDNILIGIFEMIRNNRNDAGHPTGKTITRDQAFACLQLFIPYCKKIYELIDWLNLNPV